MHDSDIHQSKPRRMKLYPIHFTRAVDTSDATRRRLEIASTGVWLDWLGLQTMGGFEFVSDPADAEALLLFQSLPFFFQWRKEYRDDPGAVRGTGTEKEIKKHKMIQDAGEPVIYFFSDFNLVMNDIYKRVKWRGVLYNEWGLHPIDGGNVHVIHYCLNQKALVKAWHKRRDSVKVPEANFYYADIDAVYWQPESIKPASVTDPKHISYFGNSRRGRRSGFLSMMGKVHVYGKWNSSGDDKWKPGLPNATFFKPVPQHDVPRQMNRYWAHAVTQDDEATECRATCTRLVQTICAGTLPLIDTRLEYYVKRLLHITPEGSLPARIAKLMVRNESDVRTAKEYFNDDEKRIGIIAYLQGQLQRHFAQANLPGQLRTIIDNTKQRRDQK